MGKVFISYSRKDRTFVRRLYGALSDRGRKVWVDWEGIPPTDKWLVKIHSAIDEADAFLFVISPDSVTSDVCEIELDHAIKQHKRLVPVLYREVGMSSVRSELSEINYTFARDCDSFDIFCDNLITALDMDLLWIQSHTRLLVRASEWEREGRDASYTLRGNDLSDFEKWLAKSPDKEPKPTTLQLNYLLVSRQTVTRRQRIVGGAIAIGLCLAVGLGTIAYFQNRQSVRQETIAGARQLINKSEALREDAASEGSKSASIRAATKSLAILNGLGIQSLDADRAVRKSMVLPKWINFELKPESIDASAFEATNAYLVLFSGRKHLRVWDTVLRRESGSCTMQLSAEESISAVATGADGTLAMTAVYRTTKEVNATEVTVWSMLDCSRRLQVLIPGRLQAESQNRIALTSDGENLFVRSGSKLRSWDVASGSELSLDFTSNVNAFAPGPDDHWLATLERKRGERKRWVRIRDLNGNRMVREWEHPEHGLWMQWGAHGLVVGNQKYATIYNPNNGDFLHRYPLAGNGKFALSPDGRLVAVPIENHNIQIRDVVSNTEVMRNSHDNEVDSFAFGVDNRSLTTVDEVKRQIRVWSFESSGAFAEIQEDTPIQQMRFSRDGAHLYTKTNLNVSGWQLPFSGEQQAPRRLEVLVSATEIFGQHQIESSQTVVPGDATTTIKVRATDTSLESHTILLDAHALAASVSEDGNWLAVILAIGSTRGGDERRLELWNVGTERRILTRSLAPVLDVDMAVYLNFVGEGRYLAVGMHDGIDILDTKRLSPVATLYHWGVTLTAVQGDGTLAATTGGNGVVRIWDMSSRNEIVQIVSANALRGIALSNDNRWLATLEDTGSVRLWLLAPEDLIEQACKGMAETCP